MGRGTGKFETNLAREILVSLGGGGNVRLGKEMGQKRGRKGWFQKKGCNELGREGGMGLHVNLESREKETTKKSGKKGPANAFSRKKRQEA